MDAPPWGDWSMLAKYEKSCRMAEENFRAVLGKMGLPNDLELKASYPDRCFFAREECFIEQLEKNPQFERWDLVANHIDVTARLKARGETAIRGWRQKVARYSMQIVEHRTEVIEIDIDLWNPDYGLLPLICHGIEVWRGKQTDPFAVRKGLAKRYGEGFAA